MASRRPARASEIASCTPRTHEPIFQDTLREAGLNPFLFEMANIRDQASWVHFTGMLFDNPAAGSVGQDVIVTNAILFPLWTMIDGPRRGLKGTWIYFTMSLFTSFGFAMGLYLAAQERQVRWNAARRG